MDKGFMAKTNSSALIPDRSPLTAENTAHLQRLWVSYMSLIYEIKLGPYQYFFEHAKNIPIRPY